jgi:hypothetical protein
MTVLRGSRVTLRPVEAGDLPRLLEILRRYERSHDGTFHAGVLLDLLAEDLR